MQLKKILPGVAAGALALAAAAPGFAQHASPVPAPQAPAVQPQAPASNASFDPAVARRMTADELKKHFDAKDKVILVDTRSAPPGPIAKGAHIVPLHTVATWAKDVAKDALIVAYCT